ncbi:MAG: NAD-dependent epimerase/dehydratase family protein [Pseudomonadota bacterium]
MSEDRILITGASGFLGRALIQELQQFTHSKSYSLFTLSRSELKISGVNHASINLENRSEIATYIKEVRPTMVYHLSGLSKVSNAISFKDYFMSNYLQTRNLIDSLDLISEQTKILLASSVHVYGNQKVAVSEESGIHPQSAYAFSKYLSEECLRNFTKKGEKRQSVVTRLSTCFGPGQALGFVASDFAHKVKEAKLKKLKKITTGPLHSFRQFMDFRDVARAFKLMMEHDQRVPFEIYNLASPHKTSIQSLLNELLALAKIDVIVESHQTGDNSFLGLDIPATQFHSKWPNFTFRPLKQTLSEIWELSQKAAS